MLAPYRTDGPVSRTDLWMFRVRYVPGLGLFLTHPDNPTWVDLLSLPELNLES